MLTQLQTIADNTSGLATLAQTIFTFESSVSTLEGNVNDLSDRVDYYQIGDRVLDKSNNTSYFLSPVGWVDSLGNKKEIKYVGLFSEKPTEEDGIKK